MSKTQPKCWFDVSTSIRSLQDEHNRSEFTDHATQENHIIKWSQATVIDRELDRFTRRFAEAVHIRKEGQQAVNRAEGSCQLGHAYDRFRDTARSRHVKNRKKLLLDCLTCKPADQRTDGDSTSLIDVETSKVN